MKKVMYVLMFILFMLTYYQSSSKSDRYYEEMSNSSSFFTTTKEIKKEAIKFEGKTREISDNNREMRYIEDGNMFTYSQYSFNVTDGVNGLFISKDESEDQYMISIDSEKYYCTYLYPSEFDRANEEKECETIYDVKKYIQSYDNFRNIIIEKYGES